jgi:hypothetical protein
VEVTPPLENRDCAIGDSHRLQPSPGGLAETIIAIAHLYVLLLSLVRRAIYFCWRRTPSSLTWPPVISFPYVLPMAGSSGSSGSAFQILADPPAFDQGLFDGSNYYNVNAIVQGSDGNFYRALCSTNADPVSGGTANWAPYTGYLESPQVLPSAVDASSTNTGSSATNTATALTPGLPTDFAIFATNIASGTPPSGWTLVDNGFYSKQLSNVDPLTPAISNGAYPTIPVWANALATIRTNGTPAVTSSGSWGSGGLGAGEHTCTVTVVKGQCIIAYVDMDTFGASTGGPLTLTDSIGTNYTVISATNVFSYNGNPDDPYTVNAYLFIGFAQASGLITATLTIPAGLDNVSSCGIYAWNGLQETINAPFSDGLTDVRNVSTDGGTSYNPIGKLAGNSIMGVTYSADYPSNTSPDSTHTLHVDLTESDGELESWTSAQQNQLIPIMLLDNNGSPGTGSAAGYTTTIPYEIVAYQATTLASASKYSAAPPILRGQLGSVPADHPIGSVVVDLSNPNSVFKYIIPNSQITGNVLYFKFQSYNQFTTGLQDISDCTAYTFTITGQTNPSSPTSPAAGGSYTISPNPCLYQGRSGGWSGIDSDSATWTNTDKIYFPPLTVNFSGGSVSYDADDAGTTAFTGPEQTVYVCIYDPTQAGGTPTVDVQTTNEHATTPGYIFLGSITSAAAPTAPGSTGGSSGSGGPQDSGVPSYAIEVNGVLVPVTSE